MFTPFWILYLCFHLNIVKSTPSLPNVPFLKDSNTPLIFFIFTFKGKYGFALKTKSPRQREGEHTDMHLHPVASWNGISAKSSINFKHTPGLSVGRGTLTAESRPKYLWWELPWRSSARLLRPFSLCWSLQFRHKSLEIGRMEAGVGPFVVFYYTVMHGCLNNNFTFKSIGLLHSYNGPLWMHTQHLLAILPVKNAFKLH